MTFTVLAADELEARGGGWTAREIRQQPAMWAATEQLVQVLRPRAEAFLAPLLARTDLRVVLSGAGSSDYIGRSLVPDLLAGLGRRVEAIATTDLVVGGAQLLQRDVPTLLVSFARSGNSPESVAATEIAEAHLAECRHLIITCNGDGALYRRHHGRPGSLVALLPEATHDRGFAMTSSFTSMALAARRILLPAQPIDIARIGAAADLVCADHGGSLSATAAGGFKRVVYLGSRGLAGIADEAALKLLELTDGEIMAMAQTPLGFRHGPKTFVDGQTLVVLFLSNDPQARRYELDVAREIAGDGIAGRLLVLAGQGDGLDGLGADLLPGLEAASDAELSFPYLTWAQAFALGGSLALGRTPDNPSRTGAVNRVVQGVTIYPEPGRA
ncbi:SIS domain-containing protein [Nitrospirillum bahiense]|uniref:Galactosamine 6-phosphate isomerase AgaS n=1 Tax=Nitrospirillum amazonense TaxID=28077 RepID=A0A560G359_9PROT|nr:SIS domain-containing protein [Nitrospirillum amazonense]TWB28323.1 galactosamine 6-phosphate isomerase AgaS [Nitrospirillum amazonense]